MLGSRVTIIDSGVEVKSLSPTATTPKAGPPSLELTYGWGTCKLLVFLMMSALATGLQGGSYATINSQLS